MPEADARGLVQRHGAGTRTCGASECVRDAEAFQEGPERRTANLAITNAGVLVRGGGSNGWYVWQGRVCLCKCGGLA